MMGQRMGVTCWEMIAKCNVSDWSVEGIYHNDVDVPWPWISIHTSLNLLNHPTHPPPATGGSAAPINGHPYRQVTQIIVFNKDLARFFVRTTHFSTFRRLFRCLFQRSW